MDSGHCNGQWTVDTAMDSGHCNGQWTLYTAMDTGVMGDITGAMVVTGNMTLDLCK